MISKSLIPPTGYEIRQIQNIIFISKIRWNIWSPFLHSSAVWIWASFSVFPCSMVSLFYIFTISDYFNKINSKQAFLSESNLQKIWSPFTVKQTSLLCLISLSYPYKVWCSLVCAFFDLLHISLSVSAFWLLLFALRVLPDTQCGVKATLKPECRRIRQNANWQIALKGNSQYCSTDCGID